MESFKMALRSIAGNKMRSFLTMLGIIIGVASVIMLVSIVHGYMNSMIASFSDMGVDQINVYVTNTASRSLDTDEFYDYIGEHSDLYAYMTPTADMPGNLKNGSESMSYTSIGGYSEDYLNIKGYKLQAGRNLSYSDMVNANKVTVMGYYTAWYMFGSADAAVGQKVKINGNVFEIIGVVEKQDPTYFEAGGMDDFAWIPYSTAAKISKSGRVSNFIVSVRDPQRSEEATADLENYLDSIFMSSDLYSVYANSSMLKEMNSMISRLSLMLGGIAGISLLVAGVGVMNIMLVSVTERTREIGIRKALGAKRMAIMIQFVIEAAVTSTIGGIIGIIVGSAFTSVIGTAIGIKCTPTISAVLISFSVSVGIGLIFGYMPARRAAKLNPIDALRSE
ncbi:MAG: ABC transporter permease [Lachnospiraceae bacterium]|nr:ABC transporter permease [Lachnospiraceae bacterium]